MKAILVVYQNICDKVNNSKCNSQPNNGLDGIQGSSGYINNI